MPPALLSLQLGAFANFVGAHFWNAQDEAAGWADAELQRDDGAGVGPFGALDAAPLFRQGGSASAPTFTPRLVLLDLADALGGVGRGDGCTAAEAAGLTTWDGPAQLVLRAAVRKSAFVRALEAEEAAEAAEAAADAGTRRDGEGPREPGPADVAPEAPPPPPPGDAAAGGAALEGAVEFWTDYAKAALHPRTPTLLPSDTWRGAAPPAGYGDLADAAAGAAEAAAESLRFFAEECDALCGVQVTAADGGGFGAVAEAVLLRVREDYPGTPLLLLSARPPQPAGTPPQRLRAARLSEALATARVAQLADVYCPMGLRHPRSASLRIDEAQLFHAAAPLAAFADAATSPWRFAPTAPSNLALGRQSLSDVVAMLTARGCRHATAGLAFPAPPAADGLSLAALASLTEGVPGDLAAPLAELHVTRGGATPPAALHGLWSCAVRAAVTRCPRLFAAAAAPLPIPLSFPHILAQPNPDTAPAWARLATAEDMAPVLRAAGGLLARGGGGAGAAALLAGWGVAPGDCAEDSEALLSEALALERGYDSGYD